MTMKMANVEFVEFDAKDVITTSINVVITEGNVKCIWLTNEGVNLYNQLNGAGMDDESDYLDLTIEPKGYSYYAFTGKTNDSKRQFISIYQSDSTPTKITKVDESNIDLIREWLSANGKIIMG